MAESQTSETADLMFARGDGDALKSAYDAHGSVLFSYCRRHVGDERAKDITQEVFVSAWKAREQFDPAKGSLGAWLMGITKRRLIDDVRSEQRHSSRRADVETGGLGDDIQSASASEHIADRMLVADALRSLPDRTRMVLQHAYFDDMTHNEIAQHTALPLGTVKSDIRRGLTHIRHRLENSHG